MENQVRAGFFVRLAAYLIDEIIVGAGVIALKVLFFFVTLALPGSLLKQNFIFEYSVVDIILYAVGVTYFILFTYCTGSTVGKKLFHLQVVSVEDRKVTLFEVIYRETVGRFLSGLVLSIGYFLVVVHKEKKALHDLLSDTQVVYNLKYGKKEIPSDVPLEPIVEQLPNEEMDCLEENRGTQDV